MNTDLLYWTYTAYTKIEHHGRQKLLKKYFILTSFGLIRCRGIFESIRAILGIRFCDLFAAGIDPMFDRMSLEGMGRHLCCLPKWQTTGRQSVHVLPPKMADHGQTVTACFVSQNGRPWANSSCVSHQCKEVFSQFETKFEITKFLQ